MGCPQPAPGEPLWTAEDRAVVLAWQQWQDGLCPCCGVPRKVAWSRDHQTEWSGEVVQCHVGSAMAKARRKFTTVGAGETVDSDAIHTVAHRKTDG